MAITRINNNQITDSVAGNLFLGVNAAVKIQDFSVTAGKIANNLTYNSDLTVTGNLTVQGNTTAIDTINLVVEDPLILLAKEQTGAPALDIGFIGKRGTEDNIAFVWDEIADQFVAVFTTSEVTNSTISINSYASLQVLDLTAANANITGNVTFSGNIVGNLTVTGNVDANNFNATAAVTAGTTITATGNVSGGNITTAGVVEATGNVIGGNLTTGGEVVATGNVTGGNVSAGSGTIVTTGNIDGGNVNATANVTGQGAVFSGNVTADTFIGNIQGNIDAGGANTNIQFNDDDVLAGSAAFTFDKTSNLVTATGNISAGNLITGGVVSATGNVSGGNITTGGAVDATGDVTGGNLITLGDMSSNTIHTTGNALIGGNLIVQGNITYINIDDLRVEDPIIIMGTGANGAPPVADDGQDRGIFMEYYSTAWANAFVGWERSANSIIAATSVEFSANNVVNVLEYGPFTAGNANLQSANVSGNVSGGNITTVGLISATGNVSGGNITTAGVVEATGNVIGGNLTTAGVVDATGNVSGGNLTTAGVVTATGNVSGGNITTANVMQATGNVIGGNLTTAGLVEATGNVIGGNLTTAGVVAATGNVSGGNLTTAGVVQATGNVTGGNIVTTGTADLGNIRITGNDITNFASNIITINAAASDIDVRISGDTKANLLLTDAGTDTVVVGGGNATTGAALKVDTNDSMMVPVGNTIQRPVTPEIGMFRFNTGGDALEVYASTGWEDVGVPAFTVITADAFVGNGVQTVFTLSVDSTTAGTIVAINGIVQEPTTAYAVAGNVLTFTEAPAVSDAVDARILTTTTTVTNIENVSGNAVIEVLDSADTVQITGNLLPLTSNVYNLGSGSKRWNELFLQGSTITLGNVVIKNTSGNTIGFFGPNGTTPATLDANVEVVGDAIESGTSNVSFAGANGNVLLVSGGNTTGVITGTGANITGTLNATGNANVGNLGTAGLVTATGNITGGNLNTGAQVVATGNVSGGNLTTAGIVSATGNVSGANLLLTGNIFDSGTSLQINTTTAANISLAPNATIVLVATTTGANITGTLNATGNANVGNLGTAGLISATGNITGGNLITAGLVSLASITKTGSNGVGNIGSSTSVFDTVFAKATSAQYADLAEMYEADAVYEPGTVLCFGGTREVTLCNQTDCTRVAGVVSTNPSYLMNSGQTGEYVAAVALQGRVPCRVTGTIRKGDLIVSTGDGRGRANNAAAVGTVIGKALADFDGADGVIEVVVGRV